MLLDIADRILVSKFVYSSVQGGPGYVILTNNFIICGLSLLVDQKFLEVKMLSENLTYI